MNIYQAFAMTRGVRGVTRLHAVASLMGGRWTVDTEMTMPDGDWAYVSDYGDSKGGQDRVWLAPNGVFYVMNCTTFTYFKQGFAEELQL